MKRNNNVYLLIGPRGSGKSDYAKKLVDSQSGIMMVSRDEILVRLFGSVHLSPYTGGNYVCEKIMHRLLRRKLSTQKNLKLILDCWTGTSDERRHLNIELHRYGATKIVGLYFVTSLDLVNNWFWKKPEVARMSEMGTRQGEGLTFFSEDAPTRDYKLFHTSASKIGSDGFDKVIRINPIRSLVTL